MYTTVHTFTHMYKNVNKYIHTYTNVHKYTNMYINVHTSGEGGEKSYLEFIPTYNFVQTIAISTAFLLAKI